MEKKSEAVYQYQDFEPESGDNDQSRISRDGERRYSHSNSYQKKYFDDPPVTEEKIKQMADDIWKKCLGGNKK